MALWDDSSGLSLLADYATNPYATAAYPRTNFSDRLPPSAVSDLSAAGVGSRSVVPRWTAPDNEGKAAAAYSIRYRKGGLWPGVWDTATALTAPPVSALPGRFPAIQAMLAGKADADGARPSGPVGRSWIQVCQSMAIDASSPP